MIFAMHDTGAAKFVEMSGKSHRFLTSSKVFGTSALPQDIG